MAMNFNNILKQTTQALSGAASNAAQTVQNAKKYLSDNSSNVDNKKSGNKVTGTVDKSIAQVVKGVKMLRPNPIVVNATKYLGTPYVWGGSDMKEHGGMDCSGFVYRALQDSGYDVQRDEAQNYRRFGKVVSKSKMQPGDVVFFGDNNYASHVGIYTGNGVMIHSSGGPNNTRDNPGLGVSFKNVNDRADFIEARRY